MLTRTLNHVGRISVGDIGVLKPPLRSAFEMEPEAAFGDVRTATLSLTEQGSECPPQPPPPPTTDRGKHLEGTADTLDLACLLQPQPSVAVNFTNVAYKLTQPLKCPGRGYFRTS